MAADKSNTTITAATTTTADSMVEVASRLAQSDCLPSVQCRTLLGPNCCCSNVSPAEEGNHPSGGNSPLQQCVFSTRQQQQQSLSPSVSVHVSAGAPSCDDQHRHKHHHHHQPTRIYAARGGQRRITFTAGARSSWSVSEESAK